MKEDFQSKTLNHEGAVIAIEVRGNDTKVNATLMGRKYGKRVNDWFALEATKRFMAALETTTNGCSLVETREGRNGGTWLHRNAALEYARWLDPMLAVWMNDRFLDGTIPMSAPAPQQPSAPAPALTPTLVKSEFAFLDHMRSKLRLSDSSYAAMSNKTAERLGLVSRVDYTTAEDAVKSASELLKEHYIKMSTHAFNVLMAEHGLSEHVPVKNGSGYFMLTDEGKKYGTNDNHPDHQGSVQIHYYIHRFQALLDRLGLKPDPKLVAKAQAKANNKALPQPEQPSLFDITNI